MYIWQKLYVASSEDSELKSANRRKLPYFDECESLSWYILNIPWSWFYMGYSYKLSVIFWLLKFNSTKNYSLSWSVHEEFINLKGMSDV